MSNCRRKEDESPRDHTILVDTIKLLDNCSYGKMVTNKDKFTKVTYALIWEVSEKVNTV